MYFWFIRKHTQNSFDFNWPNLYFYINISVQFSCSVMSNSLWPHDLQHARPRCPSPTPGVHSDSTSIESVMPSNHFILCCPLFLPPSIFPNIRVFSSESALRIRWPKYQSFPFSISLSNEYSGLISLGLTSLISLQPKGTLRSLLQRHSSKASVLWCSTFFMVQLTSVHDYWENHSFEYTQTFVDKVMSLLFNTLSRFIITFLPRSKHLLISWLQLPSAVIFRAQEEEICHSFHFSPYVCQEWWDWVPWS